MYRLKNLKAGFGNRVLFKWASPHLTVMNLTGIVAQECAGVLRVIVDTPKGDFIPDEIRILTEQASVIADEREVIEHLLSRLNLIAGQDQGAGGNVTPEECWRSAQRIARDAVLEFERYA